MQRPAGHREDCGCPVCRNVRAFEAREAAEAQPVVEAEPMEEEEPVQEPDFRRWADRIEHPQESVFIETGRGQTAEVQAGAPFQETIERIAEESHYGGYFRVFLNGSEVVRPEEAPSAIEPGMRIALTAYDKVG